MNYSEEEKKAIESFNNYINAIETFGTIDPKCCNNLYEPAIALLNLIETQKAELGPIKKLNIPVETLVAEWERLNNLEDNTVMLKAELEKKNKIINLMAEQLTTPINDKKWVIEYYTKLAEEEK